MFTAGDLFAPKFAPPPSGFVRCRERITSGRDNHTWRHRPSPAGVFTGGHHDLWILPRCRPCLHLPHCISFRCGGHALALLSVVGGRLLGRRAYKLSREPRRGVFISTSEAQKKSKFALPLPPLPKLIVQDKTRVPCGRIVRSSILNFTQAHHDAVFPKSVSRAAKNSASEASPTQVSSYVSVACSSVPRPSSSSTTHLIELDHPGLPWTPVFFPDARGHRGQSKPSSHSWN
jgi:hypothetical protein